MPASFARPAVVSLQQEWTAYEMPASIIALSAMRLFREGTAVKFMRAQNIPRRGTASHASSTLTKGEVKNEEEKREVAK
jgi:hypothetical protein